MTDINPFITVGYIDPIYFCDREIETEQMIKEIRNGNNITLISSRRMGKTGLILHTFRQPQILNHYYTFFVDIYATKSLRDFVFALSKEILEELKPFGKKALTLFINSVKSLQTSISFDVVGNPSFNLGLGAITSEQKTLDEIFHYLSIADKPCIVAIDEFQQIAAYPENNIEAILRTYIQRCSNSYFIFAGSQRHVMGNMFLSASRPFYQSTSMLHLESINEDKYSQFVIHHFSQNNKSIDLEVINTVYREFEGITWYLQKILNTLYSITPKNETCTMEMYHIALQYNIDSYEYSFREILFRLPEKQKELLIAIAKEGKVLQPTSGSFIKKHALSSASSVQVALRVLLEKDFVTNESPGYQLYDRFFQRWIAQNY